MIFSYRPFSEYLGEESSALFFKFITLAGGVNFKTDEGKLSFVPLF